MPYDPEIWLESFNRTLKEYVLEGVDNAIKDQGGAAAGDKIYEVVFEFPGTELLEKLMPNDRALMHFEIDDPQNRLVGIGDNIFRDNFDAADDTIRPQEARVHEINLDVGVWSWDRSGGTTTRMRAYQILLNLFHGSRAQKAAWEFSTSGDGGIEILSFTGGRFLTEQIGDIPVYRIVDCQLECRVYSRTPMPAREPAIESFTVNPNLVISP